MAPTYPAEPLLSKELSEAEQMQLAALAEHPGFPALRKLHLAACQIASDDIVELDPEGENYDEKLKSRTIRARERNEFSTLILNSITWHKKVHDSRKAPEVKTGVKNPLYIMPEKANKE